MVFRFTVVLFLALLAGCGGGGDPAAPDRCLTVNRVNLDAIEGTFTDGTEVTEGAAVRSKDYKSVYMVAAKFGNDDLVGVWATNDDPRDSKINGPLMAGDGMAREFSEAAEGVVEIGSDGMDEAKDCLD